MAALFGSAKLDDDIVNAPMPEQGEFSKGLRSGMEGAGSQLRSLAGGVGAAMGFDQFAAEQNALARAQAERAAAAGPRVGSYRDVGSLRDAGDYVAGLAGQAVPSVGLGIGAGAATALTGGGALPVLAAGAASQLPFEMGDVLQRQQQDPAARMRGAGENLRDAFLTGGASAVGQAVVPAALGGKLVGKGVAGALRAGEKEAIKTAGTGITKSMLRDGLIEGAAEGGGELVKQQGVQFGATPDYQAAGDAFVGGGIIGVGAGAAGHGAEKFHENRGAMADSVQALAQKGTDALKAGAAGAKGAIENVDTTPVTDFAKRLKDAAAPKQDDAATIQSGGLSPDELTEAGNPATPRNRALELIDQGAAKAAETTQRLATAFADRADIDPDTRARFADAAANATDATKQAWVSTQAGAIKAKDTVVKAANDVLGAIKDVAEPKGDKKLSADMSGQREAIVQEVMPFMPEGAMNDPKALRTVGDAVNRVIQAISRGDVDSMEPAMQGMHRIFGDDTEALLTRIYDKVSTASPEEVARFTDQMAQSKTLRAKDGSLRNVIQSSLPEGSRADADELMNGLVSWARGEGKVAKNAALTPAMHESVRQTIQQTFGKNTDKVMKALEKHVLGGKDVDESKVDSGRDVKTSDDAGTAAGEDFGTMSERGTTKDFYSSGKSKKELVAYMTPEANAARYGDKYGESAAERKIKQLNEKFPERDFSMMPAREAAKELGWTDERLHLATKGNPDEHGFIVSERIEDPDKLGEDNIRRMRLDEGKDNSPAKLNIGGENFDAVKVTKHFLKEGQGANSGARGDVRLARAFAEGVSALTERFGKGEMTAKASDGREMSLGFDDATVIGYSNGKAFTVGDAKKADPRTEKELKGDAATAKARKDLREKIDAQREAMRLERDPDQLNAMRDKLRGLREEAKTLHAEGVMAGDERGTGDKEDILSGRQEVDQGTGNIHELEATGGVKQVNYNSDGTEREAPTSSSLTRKGQEAVADVKALAARMAATKSPAAEKIAARLEVLAKSIDSMSDPDRRDLLQLVNAKKLSEVAPVVNELASKYKDVIVAPGAKKAEPAAAAKEPAAKPTTPEALDKALATENYEGLNLTRDDVQKRFNELKKLDHAMEAEGGLEGQQLAALEQARNLLNDPTVDWGSFRDDFGMEGSPRPKAEAAKKAALDQAASSSDPALLKELRTTDDAPALQRTAAYLAENHPDSKAAQVAGEAFDRAVQDPDKSYSMQATNATQGPSWNSRQEAERVIQQSLGNSVAVAWDKLPHAGEFDRTRTGDVIRLSVFGMNPKSVAYHESLHGFFAQLRDAGAQKVSKVLEKAASQPAIKRWMENHFKNEPGVLEQIRTDPEERAAYMYQLWATEPTFRSQLNPQATTFFSKVAAFFRSVLGIWSNDQRALHIMEHFQSGEYAKNLGKPNTVALLGSGTNGAVEQFKGMVQPLHKLGDAVFGAGSARLRDTNIAAIQKIADLIKPTVSGSENTDTGYLAASRGEFTSRLNKFGESLGQPTKQQLQDALVALQSNTPASTPEARIIVRKVKETLQELGGKNGYLRQAGVDFGDLGPDYFPRVWDAETISKNQKGFLSMMNSYVQAGLYVGDPKDLMRRLIANDGNNFDVNTKQPGMQHTKVRELSFITGNDAEPFLSKDLYQTMSSYISQATRRAEWAKRFGADGRGLDRLMYEAEQQGATKEQLAITEKYLKGITGTLGDGINPEARRLMGNAIIYQNVRLLPLAIFSSVVDPMGIAVRGGTLGEAWTAFKRGVREIPENFRKYDPNRRDASTLLAESLGTIENASLMHSLGALYSQGMTGSTGRKINDTFFRFNLMEQYNRSMRVAATESAISFIGRHAAGADPKNSARWLSELNLDKSDVSFDANGRMKLTTDDGLSQAHADKMRDAVNKWVDGAVLRPDQADKPIWFNDPHFALISHLKQFTYAFQHTIIDRVVREAKEGNYKPAAMLSSYVPIMIAADYMKGFIQGGGEQPSWKRDWGPADYMWSGVQRAGLLGVGQFGADAAVNVARGESPIGSLAGPTVEQLGDAASVVGGRGRFAQFSLDAMPANTLYSSAFKGSTPKADPVFTE